MGPYRAPAFERPWKRGLLSFCFRRRDRGSEPAAVPALGRKGVLCLHLLAGCSFLIVPRPARPRWNLNVSS